MPQGPQLDVYLTFTQGRCAEAMRFYEKTLGGKLNQTFTYGSAPPAPGFTVPPGAEKRVMHTSMQLGDRVLMASDALPGHPGPAMQGFSLSLNYPSVDEARRVFGVLAEGGEVHMPIAETFWAEAFGMLVDRFGTPWMVSGPGKPMG